MPKFPSLPQKPPLPHKARISIFNGKKELETFINEDAPF